jgi:hypothetical protein
MQPTAWDFRNQLMAVLNGARQSGEPHIDVESGHLHTQVGEDPNSNRISVCCEVMRKMMRIGDSIVNEPPSGEGATLMIRYIVQATGTRL